ncbi:hypothetical protein ABPG73_010183 [Tetrahymena malaccensis]
MNQGIQGISNNIHQNNYNFSECLKTEPPEDKQPRRYLTEESINQNYTHKSASTASSNTIYEKEDCNAKYQGDFIVFEQREEKFKNQIIKLILSTFKSDIVLMLLTNTMYNWIKMLYSSCLISFLDAVQENSSNTLKFSLAALLTFLQLLEVIIGHNILRFYYNFFPVFKATFMKLLYQKIITLSAFSVKQASVGKLINLVSNDLNTLDSKGLSIIKIITISFDLLIVAIVLYTRLGYPSLLGFGFIICYPFFQTFLAKKSQRFFKMKAQLVDQRIKFTNEIIEGIRLIKMYAWEQAFIKFVEIIRSNEISKILVIQIIYFFQQSLTSILHLLACFISFLSTYYLGDSSILTVPRMLSVLDLFSFTKVEIITFASVGVTGLYEFKVIIERALTVLQIEQYSTQNIQDTQQARQEISDQSLPQGTIKMINFKAFWNLNTPVLKDINLEIKSGDFVAIVGRIGSGKSSLFSSILQEIPYIDGQLKLNGRIAYVEQEPYIFSSSIKENIVFGFEFNEKLYNQVLEACCLLEDIQMFDNGDQTQIGERGVAKKIVEKAILIMLKGKTILMVTHHIHFTQKADQILVINDGQIYKQGIYQEMQICFQEIFDNQDLTNSINNNSSESQTHSKNQIPQFQDVQQIEQENSDPDLINLKAKDELVKVKKIKQIFTSEQDENMIVNFSTYKKYFGYSSMRWLIPLMVATFISCEIFYVFYTKTISNYNEEEEDLINRIYLLGYLTLIYFVNYLLNNLLFTSIIYSSNKNIHKNMIKSLVRATVLFFDQTPSGRILNKFSSDLGILDQQITRTMINSIEIFSKICDLMITIFIINPYFIFVLFIQLIFTRLFVNFSKQSLEQSKQLDLRYRSPIYTRFNQTVQGVLPIKIYKKENIFLNNFSALLKNSLKATLSFNITQRGFSFYIHLAAAVFSNIGIYMIMLINENSNSLGQVVLFFIAITDTMQFGLRMLIETDISMSSAQRVMNMIDITQEPQLRCENDTIFIDNKQISMQNDRQSQVYNFPVKGQIEFQNVRMKYRNDLNFVLNGLSFKINAGEKVEFVGRTGAGKSSIIQALYRMTEIEEGPDDKGELGFIKIDGFNLKDLGINTVRAGISIIPQMPFIFSGSIRRNLDPLNEYTDNQINQILEEICLKDKIANLKEGFFTDMTNASDVFSSGEKQLICLGRAILRQSKVIVLDEATANCDLQTDKIIQQKIRERFNNSTLITIAHRLNTIADYDRIIVLENGSVVEQGTPYELLQQEKSIFKEMVLQTGQKNFNQIAQQAKISFKKQ